MTRIDAVIIRRSNDENTVALVSAECDPEMVGSTNDLFGAISQAVTRWTQKGAGKHELRANNGDINVGDLSNHLDDGYLQVELEKVGVTGLTITCHAADKTSWDYDDNLYDEAHLED